MSEPSQVAYPGPMIVLRGRLPSVPSAGSSNASGSKYCCGPPRTGLADAPATRFGRCPAPPDRGNARARSKLSSGENGTPERIVTMPGELPAMGDRSRNAVAAGFRQLPHVVEDEVVADVVVGQSLVQVGIFPVRRLEAVVEVAAADGLRTEVFGLTPRVRRLHVEVVAEATARADDQRLVPGLGRRWCAVACWRKSGCGGPG